MKKNVGIKNYHKKPANGSIIAIILRTIDMVPNLSLFLYNKSLKLYPKDSAYQMLGLGRKPLCNRRKTRFFKIFEDRSS